MTSPGFMSKYLRAEPYRRRLKMIPHLTKLWGQSLVSGEFSQSWKPLVYPKYEGEFADVVSQRHRKIGVSLTLEEVYTLYSSVLAVDALPGAIAEVGVHRGGSARVICEAKGDKALYLCDTFAGMPDGLISADKDEWAKGTHKDTSIDEVRANVAGYPNVHFIQGVFPYSVEGHPSEAMTRQRYSFVHLDVDLYESTLSALKFFYPRLVEGGRLVSHNYNLSRVGGGNTPGVKAAFLEFFGGDRHPIIEIAETQCMVIR